MYLAVLTRKKVVSSSFNLAGGTHYPLGRPDWIFLRFTVFLPFGVITKLDLEEEFAQINWQLMCPEAFS